MAQLVAAETVTPRTLDPSARQELEDALYDVHRRIFRGVDREAFLSYVVGSQAEHTWIQLYRDAEGALGGYLAVHIYERQVAGETIAVVRGEVGTLREHRGANLVAGFFAERVLRYRLVHPRRPLYLLASFVHPSSYSQLVRFHDGVWPREEAETPADVMDLMNALGDSFGIERVHADNALVREVGWQTIDSAADRAYWRGSERPGVQFFLRQNPGYGEGHGLLSLAPLTLGAITRGIGRYMLSRGERGVRKLASRARAVVVGRLPAPAANATAR